MNNAQRTGQRILALACPLAAALYVGTDGLVSNGQRPDRSEYGSRPQSSADRSKHSVQPYISASPRPRTWPRPQISARRSRRSCGAIAMLIRERGSTAATNCLPHGRAAPSAASSSMFSTASTVPPLVPLM